MLELPQPPQPAGIGRRASENARGQVFCLLPGNHRIGAGDELAYSRPQQGVVAWAALLRTLVFTAIVVPLSIAGSLGLATIINRRLRAVGLWRTVFFLPSVVPVVAMAIMWKLVFNKDSGILNAMLGVVGIKPISWFADPTAFYALIIVMLWSVGGGMVIMLAALQGVPRELEEAAMLDGAGRWRVFWHVTVPMISPILFFQVITGVIVTLQESWSSRCCSQTRAVSRASAPYRKATACSWCRCTRSSS